MRIPLRLSSPIGRVLAVVGLLAVGGGALAWSIGSSAQAAASAAPEAAPALPELGILQQEELGRVRSLARHVVLVGAHAAVPADAMPCWALTAGGMLVTRRAASVPSAPQGAEHELAAIVLPEASLSALGPDAKAALLTLLGQLGLRGERAVRAIEVRGLDDEPFVLARLLRWMP